MVFISLLFIHFVIKLARIFQWEFASDRIPHCEINLSKVPFVTNYKWRPTPRPVGDRKCYRMKKRTKGWLVIMLS
jgi:hypothetical protein